MSGYLVNRERTGGQKLVLLQHFAAFLVARLRGVHVSPHVAYPSSRPPPLDLFLYLQEIQAYQVGLEAPPEFRTLAEDGDASELLVSAPPSFMPSAIAGRYARSPAVVQRYVFCFASTRALTGASSELFPQHGCNHAIQLSRARGTETL